MPISIKTTPKTGVYDKHLESKPTLGFIKIDIASSHPKSEKVIKDEEIVIHKGAISDQGTGFEIEVGGGRTINLGNYESAKIDVRIRAPSTKESLEEVYEWATGWVSDKISEAVDAAKGKS